MFRSDTFWRNVLFCGGPLEGEVLTIGAHLNAWRAWDDKQAGKMLAYDHSDTFIALNLDIITYDITMMEVAPDLGMSVGVIPAGHPVNHVLPMILNMCALMAAPGGLRDPR